MRNGRLVNIIPGLHGLLKSIQKPCHLKSFAGQTLAVDAYGWLHRGTVACSVDLVLRSADQKNNRHIDYVLHRVRMLLYFGVIPYMVFDGDNLPSKAATEQDRHKRRQESKALGLELQRKGRIAEAYQEFQKAVDVTPYMARQLIEELKKINVQYVVAPYEADPQMVYLEKHGIVQGIISEDSDLLVFGAKRLLSKLDQHGDCIEINRADFTACRDVSLVGWSDVDFRQMCILSGCDYLANIPKMGLKTAYRSIRKHKNVERALRMLQFDGQYKVPADYLKNFKQAENTFLYQWVFCPNDKKLVNFNTLEDGVDPAEMPYIGEHVDVEIAAGVASGELDPTTKEKIDLEPLTAGKLPLGISRRQTLGSSSELKPSKPINSFFTPKRMPLAELDPNSLTPSPSQQRLLERNANNSWQANSAPLRSNSTRATPLRAFSAQGLSPMVRSVERSSFLAQSTRAPTLPSTKRQRLCSETEDSLLPACPTVQSRFFASGEQASPSGQKLSRTKKPRKSTLDVFSDEVAETYSPKSQTQRRKENLGLRKNMTIQSCFSHPRAPATRIPVMQARRNPLPSPRTPRMTTQTSLPPRQRLTPMQQLKHHALTRSRSINFPASLRHTDSSESQSDESFITTEANTPLGSEDYMVPNSSDEDEVVTSFGQSSSLDLKRFSFAAK
ncbi:hypothetical protein N7470_005391 [Penicillium chermesinum]|nr:hypothetical protein N7470_005391 [Penicillium chermesinum]